MTALRTLGRGALDGAKLGAVGALGLWVGDIVATWIGHASHDVFTVMRGLGAGLFVGLLWAIALGAAMGGLGMLATGRSLSFAPFRRWLFAGSPLEHRTRAADFLTAMVLLPPFIGVSFAIAFQVVQDVVRHENMALLIAGTNVALLAAFAVLFVPSRLVFLRIADGFGRYRVVRWIFVRAWHPVALVMTLVGLAALGITYVKWATVVLLPWSVLFRVLGTVTALVIFLAITNRPALPKWMRVAAPVVVLVLIIAGAGAAFTLEHAQWTTRRIAFTDSLLGRVGLALSRQVGDVDRDGFLSLFGGGDCSPFDPRIYPGASDLPGNRIDEDCNGEDMAKGVPEVNGRWDWPLPDDVPRDPDVVFITVDAFSPKHLQTFGYGRRVLPNLDRFARESVVFLNCFSQGPSTRLSFPSMWTSKWDSQLHYVSARRPPYSLGPEEKQLAERLSPRYETAAVIPTHYFERNRWPSMTRGFQRYDASALGKRPNDHNAEDVTNNAIRIVEESHHKPLFLWVHYYDAHYYHQVPPGAPAFGPSEKDKYDSELAHIDKHLVRLFEAIRTKLRNPVIILASDHSEAFHPLPQTRRNRYGYDLYAATLHVPLIVNASFLQPRHVEGLVSTMDIAPTIMNLLRRTDRFGYFGTSLVPELFDGATRERTLFHQFYLFERTRRPDPVKRPLSIVSLQNGQYNLILNRDTNVYELYDWNADYYEMDNLLDHSGAQPQFRALRRRLEAYVQGVYRGP